MMDDYCKFLLTKLYLIEGIARKQVIKGKDDFKEILELAIASPSYIDRIIEEMRK